MNETFLLYEALLARQRHMNGLPSLQSNGMKDNIEMQNSRRCAASYLAQSSLDQLECATTHALCDLSCSLQLIDMCADGFVRWQGQLAISLCPGSVALWRIA